MSFRSGFVAVVGRPNVGKSTLVNYFVGRKVAIASPMPQTTRHKILGVLTQPEAQVIFVDTPGIHDAQHALGTYMVKTAMAALNDADLILILVDARRGYQTEDRRVLDAATHSQRPALIVLNKVDAVRPKQRLLPLIHEAQQLAPTCDIVPVSAQTGEQMDVLLKQIIQALPEGPAWYGAGDVTDRPLSFHITELIREQVITHTFEEVPHAVAVRLDHMKDEESPVPTRIIQATILVERPGQKAILIGKGGQKLKAIGTHARREIEQLLGCHVYLELWVSIADAWRNSPKKLAELGYRGG